MGGRGAISAQCADSNYLDMAIMIPVSQGFTASFRDLSDPVVGALGRAEAT